MRKGKKYLESAKLIEKGKLYDAQEAFDLVIKTSKAKFDETVEAHFKLGVDSRHADQQVRGAVVLPHGTGKKIRVLVFAKGDNVQKALDAGADDVNADDEGFEILTAPSAFTAVCDALNQAGIETADAEVKLMPMATTPVTDVNQAKSINKFIAALEDNEDVQNVYTTADFSDEVEAALAAEE